MHLWREVECKYCECLHGLTQCSLNCRWGASMHHLLAKHLKNGVIVGLNLAKWRECPSSTAQPATIANILFIWMATRSFTSILKSHGMSEPQLQCARYAKVKIYLDLSVRVNMGLWWRGVRAQYYNGALIKRNDLVDEHLENIGYRMEVGYMCLVAVPSSMTICQFILFRLPLHRVCVVQLIGRHT